MASSLNFVLRFVSIWVLKYQFIREPGAVNGLIAYDCGHDRINLTTFSLVSIGTCQFEESKIEKEEEDIQLLQISENAAIHIYQCKINVIQSVFRCGMFSHLNLVPGGLSTFIVDISQEDCMTLQKLGTYKLQNGRLIVDIKRNSSTTHSETVAGYIDQGGACKGVPYTSGANSWSDVVVTQAIELTITDYMGGVRLEDNQVVLRNDITCPYLNGKCMDPDNGMSFWDMLPDTSCEALKYDVIWQGSATKIRHSGNQSYPISSTVYTVNSDDTVFALEIRKPISICRVSGYQTEHPRLVIVPKVGKEYWFTKRPVNTKNFDLFTYINSKFVYTERHIRIQVERLYINVLMKKCELERDVLQMQLSIASHHPAEFAYMRMKEPGYTAVSRGELVYLIKCQPVEVSIKRIDRCFHELPITYNNQLYFMTPSTHLIQQHGTEIPCSSLMSPGYFINGHWYGFNPYIHRRKGPVELKPSNTAEWTYEDPGTLIKAGIYSSESIENLRRQIMYPSERQAITNILTQKMMGTNVDNQNINVLELLSSDSVSQLAESLKTKVWGVFTWWGNLSAGIIGIYLIGATIKFMVDTIINAKILRAVYGWSWTLLAALCNSITKFLIYRYHRSQARETNPVLTSVVTHEDRSKAENLNEKQEDSSNPDLSEIKRNLYPSLQS